MKTDYLNNITVEATAFRSKYRRAVLIKNSRLKHLLRLLKYRDRAYYGK